jgi:hypothetical protein
MAGRVWGGGRGEENLEFAGEEVAFSSAMHPPAQEGRVRGEGGGARSRGDGQCAAHLAIGMWRRMRGSSAYLDSPMDQFSGLRGCFAIRMPFIALLRSGRWRLARRALVEASGRQRSYSSSARSNPSASTSTLAPNATKKW